MQLRQNETTFLTSALGVLLALGAGCGEDVGTASLAQAQSGAHLTDLDAIASGHVREVLGDTDADVGDTTGDTQGGSDARDTNDATVPPVDTSADGADGADVTPVACDKDGDCPDPGTCGAARCADHVCTVEARKCNDHDACTDDRCEEGVGCVFEPFICPELGDDPCQTAACDHDRGCVSVPSDNGTSCATDACMIAQTCQDGVCAGGTPLDCDDGNGCTLDACDAAVGCAHETIAGCDPASCAAAQPGSECDDGDAATSGDMCLGAVCRGFALTRLPGSTIPTQEGLVFTETRWSDGVGWTSVGWVASSTLQLKYGLVAHDVAAAPVLFATTLQGSAFAGLMDGFVGDENGRIWRYANNTWSKSNDWDSAISNSGRGSVKALFTLRDVASQGAMGKRRLWALGEADGAEWIRACGDGENGVKCSAQELDDFDASSLPRAVFGMPKCSPSGTCAGALLIAAADAPGAGGEAWTDTYENSNGADQLWAAGSVPSSPEARASRDVVGWGAHGAEQFLVVGNASYTVHRTAAGVWAQPVVIDTDPNYRNFTGAWSGLGVVMLSAESIADDGSVNYELWTCPTSGDVEDPSAWTVHVLANGPDVDWAGLYDVQGRENGEVRAVGGIRRTNGVTDWLDGAVFVRAP